MAIINIREFYTIYTHDEYVEVSDEVAEALVEDMRYEKAHDRRTRRNKAQYSLDAWDGIETASELCSSNNPEVIVLMMEERCDLCQAMHSLPEKQRRRIEAHIKHGISQTAIAAAEGVTKGSVSISITRGLEAMKVFLNNSDSKSNFCPQSDLVGRR